MSTEKVVLVVVICLALGGGTTAGASHIVDVPAPQPTTTCVEPQALARLQLDASPGVRNSQLRAPPFGGFLSLAVYKSISIILTRVR